MKSLITSIILLGLIYLGLDKVSIWVLLLGIVISQAFNYKNIFSVCVITGSSFVLAYYIFLFDGSYFLHNVIFLITSLSLGVLYSSLEQGHLSIIPGKKIDIPSMLTLPNSPQVYLFVFCLFCLSIYMTFPYLTDVFYNTSDFVTDKIFFTLLLLGFSIYGNYFLEEDFRTFITTLIEEKSFDSDSLLSIFDGLNFIKIITSIVLIISISLNSGEYINNFGDAFYNITTIFSNKDNNPISELVRMINEIFISLFF